MKLLQLLAKELREWPEADCEQGPIESMSQAGDMQVSHYSGVRQVWREDVHDWSGHDYVPCSRFTLPELATDHATAIVTRADWEAEKARIAGKVDGGWKRNRGRSDKCPVPRDQPVKVKCRDGAVFIRNMPDRFDWKHQGTDSDIMRWKLHKPAEQPAPVSEEAIIEDKTGNLASLTVPHHMLFGYASKEAMREATGCESLQEVVQMIAKGAGTVLPGALESVSCPLEWRNRIYELDTQRAELEATYQRQVGEIDWKRGELVGKLASEGLALVEVAVQPVEDMSDPVNWRKGDLITFVEEAKDRCFTTGKQYVFEDLDGYGSAAVLADDEGDENGWAVEYFKWHSRPGK